MSSAPDSRTKPLSGQALDRLELMLESGLPGWEPMPLDMLQGYLFGVAAAPVEITPDEWLPRALGTEHWPDARGEAAEWADLLVRYYQQQLRALQGEADVELVTYDHEDTPGSGHRFELWCAGFLDAVDLAGAEWEALADPEELDELLFPFHVLANALPPHERERYPDKEWTRLQSECSDDLWPAVNDAARYGLALRNRPATVKRDAPKTGRNDPCPCGSGRKFKACCGKTN